MTSTHLEATGWQRSSYSTGNAACVEVAQLAERTAVRDSKDPEGPALAFGRRAFALFVEGLRGRG